jgi:uncharacterized protein
VPEVTARIPMTDGVRLAATLFVPEGEGPWPAILEALPYRKDDSTQSYWSEYRRLRDEGGYVVARVDLRGTGSSEGLALDEYTAQEQRDLCEVVAWLATQDWSTGAVGMYGTSYSGFNAIQVAMERPPELRAIIAIYATDDRYTDDVHYAGGARRCLDVVDYPTYMVAMNALPPVPSIFGEGWREEWRRRVEGLDPWLIRWIEEQTDGPYWRHGSLRPAYDRIECPVMIIGGWADGYRNATFRVLERLRTPGKLLMGPWSHRATEASLPGPRIDAVPGMIRWWDRWLKGQDNGVDREPPISVFVRRSTKPEPDLDGVRGEWRFEPGWPPERLRDTTFRLEEAEERSGRGDVLEVRGDVGPTGSIWCAAGLPFGQPLDQQPDEALSLVYDWPELEQEMEILGYPQMHLTVRSSAAAAFVSAKLCDVFPDGTSALVSRGLLNLTHRASHERPEPLAPGEPYQVMVELDATSWVFEAGHRIRLDLAGADWPNVWSPPGPATLSIDRTGGALVLPVIAGPPPYRHAPAFAAPRAESPGSPPTSPSDLATRGGVRGSGHVSPDPVWRIEHDVLGRERRVVIAHGSDTVLEDGSISIERYAGEAVVSTVDPARASASGQATFRLQWPEATVESSVRTSLQSDAGAWRLEIELDVTENDEARWSRRWERRVPRRLA